MFTSSLPSHSTASSGAACRFSKVPVNLLFPHSLIVWWIVWASAPQSHLGSSFKRHLCINWLHWPWPVRIQFSLVHNLRERDEPGCSEWISLTKFPLIGRLHFHSSCHMEGFRRSSVFIDFTLSRNGCRDLSLGFSTPYSWIGRFVLHAIFSAILSTAFCLLICGGSMLAKTGSHCVGVDLTVPKIIRIVFRSSTSMRLQWWLPSHIGAQYSATYKGHSWRSKNLTGRTPSSTS